MEEEKRAAKKSPEAEKKSALKKIAVIRISGGVGLKRDIKDTLEMLRLYKKNCCVVLDETPSITGMVKKVKDFVAWGEVSEEVIALLEKGKGKVDFFRLSPPKGGYGRKGTKVPFKIGGALGYRRDKINDLIKRML